MTRSRDIADQQKNLGGAVSPAMAGKNAIINGGFDIWQRGTSFTNGGLYTADRWYFDISASTVTSTRESTIVPAGFQYSWKINKSAGSSTATLIGQTIETANAIQFAGKTVTVSFYAAADSATTFTPVLTYSTSADNPRSGSWTNITPTVNGSTSVSTTTFVRIVSTFAVPSNAKSLYFYIEPNIASGVNVYITGFQLELGSVATPFSRANGTIQGELAACQRYFYRANSSLDANVTFALGWNDTTTQAYYPVVMPVTLRSQPSISFSAANTFLAGIPGGSHVGTATATNTLGAQLPVVRLTVASGLTAGNATRLLANSTANAFIDFSAEL